MSVLNRKYSIAVTISFLISVYAANAQTKEEGTPKEALKAEFSGFFKYDCWFDSRKNIEALDGLFLLYPQGEIFDNAGKDINEESSVNMLALTTRLNTTISGSKVFNAESLIFIEGDFSGVSGSISHVRFRHAFAKLSWDKTEVLAGRFWHPLFVTDVFPTVASLNTGVPFQAFSRSPQLRIMHRFTNLEAIATAAYQVDYKSNGPNGRSSEYIRNAKIPNLNFRLQYKTKKNILGFSADYKVLKPSSYSNSLIDSGAVFKNDKKIEGLSLMAYGKATIKKLTLKAKAMNGQNLYEHLLPGGYAVSHIDSITGERSYTSSQHLFFWTNLIYGQDVQFGIMGGYLKNLGFTKNIISGIYARGSNIEYIYRISPHISLRRNKLKLILEWERTTAAYGIVDLQNKGKIEAANEVTNNRLLFSMLYFF